MLNGEKIDSRIWIKILIRETYLQLVNENIMRMF